MNHVYFIISWMYECYSDVADFFVRPYSVSMVLVVILIFIVAILFCD